MKERIHLIIAAFACVLIAPLFASAQPSGPSAILQETHFLFGTAVEGDIVRHDFILLNQGSADLKIEKIKTG